LSIVHEYITGCQICDSNFVRDGNGILFEFLFHADDAKADIQSFWVHLDKSGIMIIATSIFRVDEVCEYQVPHELSEFDICHLISKVHLSS
jgi:hypothetical protein